MPSQLATINNVSALFVQLNSTRWQDYIATKPEIVSTVADWRGIIDFFDDSHLVIAAAMEGISAELFTGPMTGPAFGEVFLRALEGEPTPWIILAKRLPTCLRWQQHISLRLLRSAVESECRTIMVGQTERLFCYKLSRPSRPPLIVYRARDSKTVNVLHTELDVAATFKSLRPTRRDEVFANMDMATLEAYFS